MCWQGSQSLGFGPIRLATDNFNRLAQMRKRVAVFAVLETLTAREVLLLIA